MGEKLDRIELRIDSATTVVFALVSAPVRRDTGSTSQAAYGSGCPDGVDFKTVHVCTEAAGGEVRGYIQHSGMLEQRLPDYIGQWDAVDQALANALGMPVIAHGKKFKPPPW